MTAKILLLPGDGIGVEVTAEAEKLIKTLAELYGVTTSQLNQAVRRNSERFPDDFAYPLTQHEFASLRSQNVISKKPLRAPTIET